MKIKKIILLIISITLMSIPTQIFAWLQYSTYEVCNIVNVCISWLLKIVAFSIAISYIVGATQYIKHSKKEKKQKIKSLLIWLIITIVQVMVLLGGSLWVTEIGMEKYWSTGERIQFNDTDVYISNGIRIIAFILIIVYIITAIIYFFKSKREIFPKIMNVIRWQIITLAIVAALLGLARNW